MVEIIQINNDNGSITEYIIEQKVINIDELISQRDELINGLNVNEPSDLELIQYAKTFHPYYGEKLITEMKINDLNNEISELQNIV